MLLGVFGDRHFSTSGHISADTQDILPEAIQCPSSGQGLVNDHCSTFVLNNNDTLISNTTSLYGYIPPSLSIGQDSKKPANVLLHKTSEKPK